MPMAITSGPHRLVAALGTWAMASPPSAMVLPSSPASSLAQQILGTSPSQHQLVTMTSSLQSSILTVNSCGLHRLVAFLVLAVTLAMASPPSATALPSSRVSSQAQQSLGTSPSHRHSVEDMIFSLPSSIPMAAGLPLRWLHQSSHQTTYLSPLMKTLALIN